MMFGDHISERAIELSKKEIGKLPYYCTTEYINRLKKELEECELSIIVHFRPYYRRSLRRIMGEDAAAEYIDQKLDALFRVRDLTTEQIEEAKDKSGEWVRLVGEKAEAIQSFWASQPFEINRYGDKELIQLKIF